MILLKIEDGLCSSGWLFKLFPYLSNGKKNPYFNFDKAETKYSSKDFDYQISQVPFVWNYYGTHFKMLFSAGLLAIHSDDEDGALTPVLAHSVTDDVRNMVRRMEKIEKEERLSDLTGPVSFMDRISKFFVCGRN